MPVRNGGLPREIAQAPLGTVRPRDVAGYANPRKELLRLAARGLLHRPAEESYTVVPIDRVGGDWLPTLEGATAGIGAAEFGAGRYALIGVSGAPCTERSRAPLPLRSSLRLAGGGPCA